MCTRVTCRSCGKPTFSGCGQHVESVLRDVPREKRCSCAPVKSPGLLASLFGLGKPGGGTRG
jgi:hypothetical protein